MSSGRKHNLARLTQVESRLIEAASSGNYCICGTGELPAFDSTSMKAKVRVRAEVIRALLAQPVNWPVHERGVNVRGAMIVGKLDLQGISACTPLNLINCIFDEKPVLSEATIQSLSLAGSRMPGMEADRLVCRGNVHLDDGFESTAQIGLTGATIGGGVKFGGLFRNQQGAAINAQGLECKGQLVFDRQLEVQGEVNISRSRIGVALVCIGSALKNRDGVALNAKGMECGGDVFLSEGFMAQGEVSLARARVAGQLTCTRGSFTNHTDSALNLEGLVCGGDVSLDKEFSADGEVTLAGARVDGQLICTGGIFADSGGRALNAQGIDCRGDVFLRSGFRASGDVNLAGATIAGQVSFIDAEVDGQVIMYGAKVGGQFFWKSMKSLAGAGLNLDGAHVRTVVTDRGSLPNQLVLSRLTYDAFDPIADRGVQESWLAQAEYDPQPYQELARVLRQHGYRDGAKAILIHGERRRLAERSTGIHRRLGGYVLAATVGYGYKPGRAVLWLLFLWVIGSLVFGIAGSQSAMIASRTTPDPMPVFTALDAAVYSLDVMLPIVDLDVSGAWKPDRTCVIVWTYYRVHVAFGWVFSTLAVLGFTGLVKVRD